jgi:hypothetical protein
VLRRSSSTRSNGLALEDHLCVALGQQGPEP